VVGEFVRHRLGREIDGEVYGEADAALFGEIVGGVVEDRERLDQTIAAALSDEWPLARLETILRVLLEAAAYEIRHRLDIPPRVTISEYLHIADAFFAGKEPALANGVLHRLASSLRGGEL
jgi:N utilization substance protein B